MGMYDGAALARRRVGGVLSAWEATAALRAVVRRGLIGCNPKSELK